MTRDELKRVKVLERVASGSMTSAEAAASPGVTARRLRRLKASYKQSGERGLIHGNRGRKPLHALPEGFKREVPRLCREKYYGSNFCHYSELPEEHEKLKISPSSVSRILKSAGADTKRPKRRRPKKRRPRDRRAQTGMLRQVDATPHEWPGNDYGKFAPRAAIDDATGVVTGAIFTRNERMEGYSRTMIKHNKNHSVLPAGDADAHCPPDPSVSLDYVFARRETRKVGSSDDITYKNSLCVPRDPKCNFNSKVTVEVRETFSGEVVLWHDGRILKLKRIERAQRRKDFNPVAADSTRTPHKPAPDHPWRRYKISGKQSGGEIPVASSPEEQNIRR